MYTIFHENACLVLIYSGVQCILVCIFSEYQPLLYSVTALCKIPFMTQCFAGIWGNLLIYESGILIIDYTFREKPITHTE